MFATYLRERAPRYISCNALSFYNYDQNCRDLDISFTLWMDIRAEIREIIVHGARDFNFM
jgi:hypothetical protein